MRRIALATVALVFPLAACGGADQPVQDPNLEILGELPESLAPFGDGYPQAGSPCRQLGESEATSDYLDDSAILVGCPSLDAAESLPGEIVAEIDGVRLVSIPMDDVTRKGDRITIPYGPESYVLVDALIESG
ncbi:MAG: hypothetical protein WBA68_06200 [Alteraurantiacibacter sp.]